MTERTFDAFAVNAVCNHPAVLPSLSLGHGEVDVSDLLANHRNVAFLSDRGGALFHWNAPGVYAAHDFFLPEGRGAWALRASREMLGVMFRDYGARLIWAETPVENRACRMFNRWLGFKSEGVSETVAIPGDDPIQVETFVMEGGDLSAVREVKPLEVGG